MCDVGITHADIHIKVEEHLCGVGSLHLDVSFRDPSQVVKMWRGTSLISKPLKSKNKHDEHFLIFWKRFLNFFFIMCMCVSMCA